MRRFSQLLADLDRTSRADAKVAAMVAYLEDVPAKDAAWALFFLNGQRVKRLIPGKVLTDWALDASGLPEWLVNEAHAAVGDSEETISLLLDHDQTRSTGTVDAIPLHQWLEASILPLRNETPASQEALVRAWWQSLPREQIFLLNKLLTGGLRLRVTKLQVVEALAAITDLPRPTISRRLMGPWQPTADRYQGLLDKHGTVDDHSLPYPFFLASTLEQAPDALGSFEDWLAEWKWEGIRGQLIRRGGQRFLWTRGEDFVIDQYPELVRVAEDLPDGIVLDGHIVAWNDAGAMPFSVLQTRIGRGKPSKRMLRDAPVVFLAYDLLEAGGEDLRTTRLDERRRRLEAIVGQVGKPLMLSAAVEARGWNQLLELRSEARTRRAEGLMLKRRNSVYGTGRQRGDWWKWQADPLSLDVVLIYAEAGSNRRTSLFTDYTFAIWKNDELVPIAKVHAGLSEEETADLDGWIRQHSVERFGPVRQVEPFHVFELVFDGIAESNRRKSGLALKSPRLVRWCTDKTPADAGRLEQVRALLNP
ncbi:MAG: ATP-dependent DNA ligase [Geminicoccaceae bacterium]